MNVSLKKTEKQPEKPASRKDELLDVVDHPTVWRWMRDLSRRDPEGFARLCSDNLVRVKRIYGRPDWLSNDNKPWTHAWAVSANGLNWVIQCSSESTWFKIRVPAGSSLDYISDPRVGAGANAFLQILLRRLMGNIE
jgi:hypothetical protein